VSTDEVMPLRANPVLPQCRCIIIHRSMNGMRRDRCPQRSSDPDSPLCDRCREMHAEGLHVKNGNGWEMAPE
jgi:hypothetical protein